MTEKVGDSLKERLERLLALSPRHRVAFGAAATESLARRMRERLEEEDLDVIVDDALEKIWAWVEGNDTDSSGMTDLREEVTGLMPSQDEYESQDVGFVLMAVQALCDLAGDEDAADSVHSLLLAIDTAAQYHLGDVDAEVPTHLRLLTDLEELGGGQVRRSNLKG